MLVTFYLVNDSFLYQSLSNTFSQCPQCPLLNINEVRCTLKFTCASCVYEDIVTYYVFAITSANLADVRGHRAVSYDSSGQHMIQKTIQLLYA